MAVTALAARPRLMLVIASTRPGRVGVPIADWIHERARAHGAFDVVVEDLAEVGLPFLDEPDHPRWQRYVHEHTREWSTRVEAADAFAFVMPEYNHGFNAPLKNALDFLWCEWQHKPVGLVSYGGISAGLRAVVQLEPTLLALRLTPVAAAVSIPFADQFLENGRMRPNDVLQEAAWAMLDELVETDAHLRPLRELARSRR